MKRKICELIIGDELRYTVETKEHWWNRWHFIMDGSQPRLFRKEELIKFKIINNEEIIDMIDDDKLIKELNYRGYIVTKRTNYGK